MTNDERQEELWAAIEQNPDNPDAYWPLIVEFVADWIDSLAPHTFQLAAEGLMRISGLWREEMS